MIIKLVHLIKATGLFSFMLDIFILVAQDTQDVVHNASAGTDYNSPIQEDLIIAAGLQDTLKGRNQPPSSSSEFTVGTQVSDSGSGMLCGVHEADQPNYRMPRQTKRSSRRNVRL